MAGKTKVLYVSDESEMCLGGQVSLFNLIKRLDRNRYVPIAICPRPGPLVDYLRGVGCPVYLLDSSSFRLSTLCSVATLKWISRFRAIIKSEGIDIIHTDRPVTTFLAGLSCLFQRVPVVWHARVRSADPILDRVNLFFVKKIIGVSKAVGERFQRHGKLNYKYQTIYNGVDCAKFHPEISGQRFRKEIGVENGQCVVGTIAQLVPQKGIREFILASSLVLEEFKDIRFVIVGTGDRAFEQKMQRLVLDKGVAEKVMFLGYRKDIPGMIAGMDICVLASWMEGLPRVVLEAMACGKPVIGTHVGGVPETIENEVTGLLVTPGNPEELAFSILRLAQNRQDRGRMGIAGRERCEELFNIDLHVSEVEKLYEKI